MGLSATVTIRRCRDCYGISHNEVGMGIRRQDCLWCGSTNTYRIRTTTMEVCRRHAPLMVATRDEENGSVVIRKKTGVHG